MQDLASTLTKLPILITITYLPRAGLIILMVDASLKGWGAVLMQVIDGVRRPARYESGIWNTAESKYNAIKREYRAVLFALKRLYCYLYRVHFQLETDAKVLIYQLNRAVNDLPRALITYWIAWIRTFDFDVKHVKGTENAAADALSRRPADDFNRAEKEEEGNLKDYIDT